MLQMTSSPSHAVNSLLLKLTQATTRKSRLRTIHSLKVILSVTFSIQQLIARKCQEVSMYTSRRVRARFMCHRASSQPLKSNNIGHKHSCSDNLYFNRFNYYLLHNRS